MAKSDNKATTSKPNKQIIIDFIISCLKKGDERADILLKVGKKWQSQKKSNSSIDRLIKIAKEQHAIARQSIQKELAEADKALELEARKAAILSPIERKELLTRIAKGEIEVPTTEAKWDRSKNEFVMIPFIELASHQARINAIAELNKMEGDYSPVKVAQTDKEGNDVTPVFVIQQLPAVTNAPIAESEEDAG
jgi:hypothetical protein